MRQTRYRLVAGLFMVAMFGVANAEQPDIATQRLQNRLELWESHARRTENLVARYTLSRRSSLLHEPLVVTGTLVFVAPDTLVLRDDAMTGSTTRMEGATVTVTPNQPRLGEPTIIERGSDGSATWLHERLVRVFAPGPSAALTEGARVHVPRGRHRLELMPPHGSAVRKVLRGVTLELDPVSGGVVMIVIAEAQGDEIEIRLGDQRQNVASDELKAAL